MRIDKCAGCGEMIDIASDHGKDCTWLKEIMDQAKRKREEIMSDTVENAKPSLDDEMLRLAVNALVFKLDGLYEEEKHISHIKDYDLKSVLMEALVKHKVHLKELLSDGQKRLADSRREQRNKEQEAWNLERARQIIAEAEANRGGENESN